MLKSDKLVEKLIEATNDPNAKDIIPILEEVVADNFEEAVRCSSFTKLPIECIGRILGYYTKHSNVCIRSVEDILKWSAKNSPEQTVSLIQNLNLTIKDISLNKLCKTCPNIQLFKEYAKTNKSCSDDNEISVILAFNIRDKEVKDVKEPLLLKIPKTITGKNLKKLIQEKTGIVPIRQYLSIDEKDITDDTVLKEGNNMNEGCTIILGLIPNSLRINVKTLTGRHIMFIFNKYDLIEDVKESIYKEEGVVVDSQRLVFAGKQLEDGNTLDDYMIRNNATLHLILRLRG